MTAPETTRAKPLTALQRETLEALATPGAVAHYMPYQGRFNPNAYWFRTTDHARCTRQVEALLKMGLLDHLPDENPYRNAGRARINAAGRATLARKETPDA